VLASLTGGDVVLDLGDLRFLGSPGVLSLLGLHRELDAHGRRLVLRRVHGVSRRVLELTGAVEILNLE
jgi:anti-anti-sigma factor